MTHELQQRYDALRACLQEQARVAVAFSGGVDSTLLAKVTHDVLGSSMVALTAHLRSVPRTEFGQARTWCAEQGIRHLVLDYDELTIPGFAQNPANRCYLCKREVFGRLRDLATAEGMTYLVDGSNLDDEGDYRPGMRALAELGVRSPLRECGFSKAQVRELSRKLGLPAWNLPSAACLSSRFAYGETITAQKLERVGAAEEYLHGLGLDQLRVRIHGAGGELARIEVAPDDIERVAEPATRNRVVERLRALGFAYVSLDLAGFRSGAMNEVL